MPDEKPKSDQPTESVRPIDPPADLGLSEGRKGMMALPADGDPSALADVFNQVDASPTDQAPSPPPEPEATPPPSDSE